VPGQTGLALAPVGLPEPAVAVSGDRHQRPGLPIRAVLAAEPECLFRAVCPRAVLHVLQYGVGAAAAGRRQAEVNRLHRLLERGGKRARALCDGRDRPQGAVRHPVVSGGGNLVVSVEQFGLGVREQPRASSGEQGTRSDSVAGCRQRRDKRSGDAIGPVLLHEQATVRAVVGPATATTTPHCVCSVRSPRRVSETSR
jgi:hypothetical protein